MRKECLDVNENWGGIKMGFWIFMLANNLLIPVVMLIFGKVFQKHPPKQINAIYGYRTKMSRLNMDTWNYAHQYFAKLWVRIGWMLLPLSAAGMFLVFGKEDDIVGWYGAMAEMVQLVVLILSVVQTERELHLRFGPDGKRKQNNI